MLLCRCSWPNRARVRNSTCRWSVYSSPWFKHRVHVSRR